MFYLLTTFSKVTDNLYRTYKFETSQYILKIYITLSNSIMYILYFSTNYYNTYKSVDS